MKCHPPWSLSLHNVIYSEHDNHYFCGQTEISVAKLKTNKINRRMFTSFKLSLQRGQYGVWSKQRSRQFLQNECPQGVVTGSKNNLKTTKTPVSFHIKLSIGKCEHYSLRRGWGTGEEGWGSDKGNYALLNLLKVLINRGTLPRA